MNIVIEKSIGLTSKGKQFDISESVTGVNFFTHEAIFLLSYIFCFFMLDDFMNQSSEELDLVKAWHEKFDPSHAKQPTANQLTVVVQISN